MGASGRVKNRTWIDQGYLVTVLAVSEQRADGLYRAFSDDGIRTFKKYPGADISCAVVQQGQLENGFIYPEIKWAMVCENDIVGGKRAKSSPQFKGGRKINVFTDLHTGDHVVHQTHGIGLYTGIESLEVEGVKREYLKVEYRDGGLLYIPTANGSDTKYIDRKVKAQS